MTPLFLALSRSNCLILGPLIQSFGASVSSSVNQRKKGTTPPCFINEMGFCRSATEQFRGLYKTTAVLLLCGCPLVTSCGALVTSRLRGSLCLPGATDSSSSLCPVTVDFFLFLTPDKSQGLCSPLSLEPSSPPLFPHSFHGRLSLRSES